MADNNQNLLKKLINTKEQEFTRQMVDVTNKATKKYGLKLNDKGQAVDCEADAFRHTYMQCYLAYKYGNVIAKKLGDMHEKGNNPDVKLDTNMDLWNNQIGREIALEIRSEKGDNVESDYFEYLASEKIIQKMRNGELITDPTKNKRRYVNMEKERIQDKDRVFYEGEFWDKLNKDEQRRFS